MSAAVHLASQGQQQRKVTFEQIAAVQNMIEKCMQLYMEKGEVMACLKTQANIEASPLLLMGTMQLLMSMLTRCCLASGVSTACRHTAEFHTTGVAEA